MGSPGRGRPAEKLRCAAGLLGLAALAVACGGGASNAAGHHPLVTAPPASTSPTSTSAPAPPSSTAPATTAAPNPPTTTAPSAPPPTAAPSSPVDHLVGVGSANQVISVIAGGYGQTTATFTAYQRTAGGWRQVFGPWTADIGYNGFAPPGAKREGDGRTPSGAYGFDFMFGVQPDPGVHFPYRVVTSNAIVWDDDPSSALYNEWVDDTAQDAGADPEPMDNPPAYSYGAVIAYNDARTPGAGSAIFLHESTGGSTAGCVSLPAGELLPVLEWLDPAQQPRIVMGTSADVTS
jgi:L,D-peptidoglycan transpeptidase YkuD (ErfK/YbiS/YcfS/YnhG family)